MELNEKKNILEVSVFIFNKDDIRQNSLIENTTHKIKI
jgi:hypothetical protein